MEVGLELYCKEKTPTISPTETGNGLMLMLGPLYPSDGRCKYIEYHEGGHEFSTTAGVMNLNHVRQNKTRWIFVKPSK
jgi:hypothetical protein